MAREPLDPEWQPRVHDLDWARIEHVVDHSLILLNGDGAGGVDDEAALLVTRLVGQRRIDRSEQQLALQLLAALYV